MTTPITHEGKELAKLPVARLQDVLLARLVVREEAARLGFAAPTLTQIASAVSEIARNVVQHSGGAGHLSICEISDGGRIGLRIFVDDTGRGIRDVDHALAGTAPGAGIPGCRKLMDELAIHSEAGKGTSVTMVKWLPRAGACGSLLA
jgi:anti-sigma regulatory factor (Ser/Thr protein kinase)